MKVDCVSAGTNDCWVERSGELHRAWAIGTTEEGNTLCRLRDSGRQVVVPSGDVVSGEALLGRFGHPTAGEASVIARCSAESVERARREAQAGRDARREASV